jgi:cardiolipin synthase
MPSPRPTSGVLVRERQPAPGLLMFGSLDLDPRSLRLDFEITLAVYDAAFTADLRRLQQHYLDGSALLDLAACRGRSALERFAEDAARLVGPLL